MQKKLKQIASGKSVFANKVIAIMLVITLTLADFILLGVVGKGAISYAVQNLEGQNSNTQHGNVKFDAYFIKEGSKTHSLTLDSKETTKLYFALNIKESGYLKNGRIQIKNANYKIAGQLETSEIMQKIEDNTIKLKQINYGTEAIVDLPIALEIENEFMLENINRESSLILSGTYVTQEGKEVNIEKEIKINVVWTSQNQINLTSRISKYKIYVETEKVLIQEEIKINKETKGLPVAKTKIEEEAPKYKNIVPEKVIVQANNLGLTTGKQYETMEFSKENWNYDSNTGKVTIEVENKVIDGKVWAGQGEDEYTITYIYGKEAITAQEETNKIQSKIKATVTMYNRNEIKENTLQNIEEKELKEEFGEIITGNIHIQETSISKGKLYANTNSNNREYETTYNIKEMVQIPYIEEIDNIKIEGKTEQFIDKEENKASTKIGGINYTSYSKTIVDQTSFEKVLGQDGYIIVKNGAGEEIGRINKEKFEITYTEKQEKIILETSKPIAEGNLFINHEKSIRADLPYLKNQLINFKQLEAGIIIGNSQALAVTELGETTTKVDMEINKKTVNKEENVEIKLELNNTNETSDLYNNPKFTIELPEYIEKAEIEKAEVLFDEELKVKKAEVTTNGQGKKEIKIELTGKQTKFNTVLNTKGTTIIVQTNLTASKTGEGKAILKVENENAVNYSTEGKIQETLNAYVTTYLDITNPKLGATIENNENTNTQPKETTTNNENNTQPEESTNNNENSTQPEENTQYLKMTVDSDTSEEYVLQRGDKYIYTVILENQTPENLNNPQWTEEDLARGNELITRIKELEEIENPTQEQTNELQDLNNELMEISKKYMVEKEKELQNLLDEKSKKKKDMEEQIEEYIELKNLKESQELTQEQQNRFNELQNIVGRIADIRNELEQIGQNLTEEQERTVEGLIEELREKEEELTSLTEEKQKRLAELKKEAEDGTINDTSIKNIKLKINLPQYIKYNSTQITNDLNEVITENKFEYDEKNNSLILEMDKYPENKLLYCKVETTVQDFGQDYLKEQQQLITLNYEQLGKKEKIEDIRKITLGKIGIELVKTTDGLKDENIVGDQITFKLQVNNVGAINCNDVITKIKLPEGLYFNDMKYGVNEEAELTNQQTTDQEDGFLVPIASLNAKDSIHAYVTATVENINQNKNLEITSTVKYRRSMEEEYQEQKTSWNVNAVAKTEDVNEQSEETQQSTEQEGAYSISGVAWVDKNSNGIKSEGEECLPQVKVTLVDVTTNKKVNTVTTNDRGEYEFTNLKPGDYQVIFEYEQNDYRLTEYKKTSEEEINSNAIKVEEGIAITDVIKIKSQSVKNINIGLIKVQKFDLKLDKRISKIIVQNKQATKTYSFNNAEIAKVEVDGKYINGTVVLVEYVIKVTNQGDVAGQVEKIVDYKPREMIFSSDLNPSWVEYNDGNLYNTELSKITIEPGETKQINLVLRKNMTEDNTGTINNRAELAEVSNKENLRDKDSIPNNKVQNEDDISAANAIIGIKTGSVILYVIVILSSLIILAIGIYFIKRV